MQKHKRFLDFETPVPNYAHGATNGPAPVTSFT